MSGSYSRPIQDPAPFVPLSHRHSLERLGSFFLFFPRSSYAFRPLFIGITGRIQDTTYAPCRRCYAALVLRFKPCTSGHLPYDGWCPWKRDGQFAGVFERVFGTRNNPPQRCASFILTYHGPLVDVTFVYVGQPVDRLSLCIKAVPGLKRLTLRFDLSVHGDFPTFFQYLHRWICVFQSVKMLTITLVVTTTFRLAPCLKALWYRLSTMDARSCHLDLKVLFVFRTLQRACSSFHRFAAVVRSDFLPFGLRDCTLEMVPVRFGESIWTLYP